MGTKSGLKTRTRHDMGEAEARGRGLLAAEGFGVLTQIDVPATLREKLGLSTRPYRILGACNPRLAAESLDDEVDVGLLHPCNVVLYQHQGGTVVAALDPATMVDLTDNKALAPIAEEARRRLGRAIDAIAEEDANA